VATKYNGGYGKVGGRSFLEIAKDVVPQGSRYHLPTAPVPTFGGIQAAAPNPGGYKGVGDAIGIKPLKIPGCPPNPINLVGTVVNYLLLGKLPELDDMGRPCLPSAIPFMTMPAAGHFENEEFVEEFGSEEAAMGYCLYKMGCRGPETYNNCPTAKFNDGTSWPVEAGHPCIGCSEPNFWDTMTPFYEEM
jgi:[NiFe] hydrogenase small subunit